MHLNYRSSKPVKRPSKNRSSWWVALLRVIVAFLVIGGMLGVYVLYSERKPFQSAEVVEFKIDGKSYRVMLADEPEEWPKGLMYHRKLPAGINGMMFRFPDKRVRTFWNKNTYMDLMVYWMDGDRPAGRSQLRSIDKTKKTVSVQSPVEVDTVVELVEGT